MYSLFYSFILFFLLLFFFILQIFLFVVGVLHFFFGTSLPLLTDCSMCVVLKQISHNISNNLGIESFLSSRSGSSRRYSAVPTFDKLNFSTSSSSHHKNTSSNLLQTIGTGVVSVFYLFFSFLSFKNGHHE